jgi:hypothetical protein
MTKTQRMWLESHRQAAVKSVIERKGRPLTKAELERYAMPKPIRPISPIKPPKL